MYLISIVIPCYNAEAFVHRSIDSVISQDYENWELILVDNNSSDNTIDILNEYRRMYPTKVSVEKEMKKGGAAARNCGLNKSRGRWIQFLDADDIILPGKLKRQTELLQKSDGDFLAASFARVVKIKGVNVRFNKAVDVSNKWKALITAKLGITSANLFSRDKVLANGGWDENLTSSQEYDLMFRLMSNGCKVVFDRKVSADIFYEGNSVTRSKDVNKNIRMVNNYIDLRLRIRDYLQRTNNLTPEITYVINQYIYRYLMDKESIAPVFVADKLNELNLSHQSFSSFSFKLRRLLKKIV